MNFLPQLKKLLLPFEDPSHELYYNHEAELKKEAELDALWAEIEDAQHQIKLVTSDTTTYLRTSKPRSFSVFSASLSSATTWLPSGSRQ